MSELTVFEKAVLPYKDQIHITQDMSDRDVKRYVTAYEKHWKSKRKCYREWRETMAEYCPTIHGAVDMGYAEAITDSIDSCNEMIYTMFSCIVRAVHDGWYTHGFNWESFTNEITKDYLSGVSMMDICYKIYEYMKKEYINMLQVQNDPESYEAMFAAQAIAVEQMYVTTKKSIKKFIPDSVLSHDRKIEIEMKECNRNFILKYLEIYPACFHNTDEKIEEYLKKLYLMMPKMGFESYHKGAGPDEWFLRNAGQFHGYISMTS